jgi:hypothetical protein
MSAPRAAEELLIRILETLRDEGDAALCEALDLLSGATGENRFRHASSIVRGGARSGRRRIKDDRDLAEVAALEAKGHSRPRAISIVARAHASPSASADSVARRYRRRLAKISGPK